MDVPTPGDLRAAVAGEMPALVGLLAELVRIPSVSAPGHDPARVRDSARHLAEVLAAEGFPVVEVLETAGGHPSVLGRIPPPPGAPTVLLYAHHDVQPPGPADAWDGDPFLPVVRDGRLVGRGASDDKAGIVVHLGALRTLGDEPGVGVLLLVDGEEEVGSPGLVDLLAGDPDRFAADVFVIADSENRAVGRPALTTSLRGLVACLVEVRTAAEPAHSGLFGGPVPDALTALARLLATLHTGDGSVAVRGLVSGEADPVGPTEAELRAELGLPVGLRLLGDGSLSARLWARPSLSVLAVDAPPVEEAINQLVPVARAKISLRTAPAQDPAAAMNALRRHLLDHAPWGVDVRVVHLEQAAGVAVDPELPAIAAWEGALAEAFGAAPVRTGVGGGIPLVAALAAAFPGRPLVLTGVADPGSRVHAPGESQHLGDLENAVLAEALALRALAGGRSSPPPAGRGGEHSVPSGHDPHRRPRRP